MGKLNVGDHAGQPNVTLGLPTDVAPPNPFLGASFPCCLCSASLEIKRTKKNKPYCMCLECGIQIFFRGKTSISRLKTVLNLGKSSGGSTPKTVQGLILWNKITQLRERKTELAAKQGLIIIDRDLDNLIRTVDNELESLQRELAKLTFRRAAEKIK
jgi:DNA-directed RNA polymerase subunit RPC12/RpoP